MLDFEKMTVENHDRLVRKETRNREEKRRYVGQMLALGALAVLSGGVLLAGLVWNVAMGNSNAAITCGVLVLLAVGTALIVGRDALEVMM